jgi:DHA1 family bicyclomycin/chloramphenicol resistance-like MFS transporter
MKQATHPDEESIRQKRLGRKGLVVFLALLSAFVPLSTDLYLPALPGMTQYFHVPEYQTNLTLILFFVFYSAAILVWGPLSDRYGRRPILLVGLACYTVAGALCAVSPNVFLLMFFRVLQAIGAGAATAVAMAIVKDVYLARKRESILALVQSMVVISPAVAPILGALILNLTSWRGAFVAQAILGLIVVAMSLAFQETLASKSSGPAFSSLRRLGFVLKNRTFARLLLIFSLPGIAGLAFISASSYIFQETFGTSSQVYSFFFAIFAVGLAIGPQIYMRLSREWERTSIITGCFAVTVVSGLLVFIVGGLGPWPFILALFPSSIALSCLRPPATYLILDQHEGDAGSASALMNSSTMVMGSVGMVIVSLGLGSRVELIGALNIIFGLLCGGLWLGIGQPLVRSARKA